jgi:hypothetical protein
MAEAAEPATSFEADIKPLFRERDRTAMLRAFDLWSLDDVRTHAEQIAKQLQAGTMPCDGAWPPARIDALQRWADTGQAP